MWQFLFLENSGKTFQTKCFLSLEIISHSALIALCAGDVERLMGIWAERVSRPGTYLEFADILLQSVKKGTPLLSIVFSEGPLA